MIRRQLHHQQSPSPPSCSVQTVPSSQTSLSSNCICFYNLREGLLNLVCLRDFLVLVRFLYSLSLMHLPPGGDSSTWRKQQASRQVSSTEHRSPSQAHQWPCSKAGPCDGDSQECPSQHCLTNTSFWLFFRTSCLSPGMQQSLWKHSGSLLQPLSASH